MNLNTPIHDVPHVGSRSRTRLNRLGIYTVRDLLRHFPARYEDFTQLITMDEIREAGQVVSVRGIVRTITTTRAWRRNLTITSATLEDEGGGIRATWFNQPYLESTLREGTMLSLSGKVSQDKRGLYLSNPSFEKIGMGEDNLRHTGRLVPIYPETEGITSKYLRFLIKPILDSIVSLPDPLPPDLVDRHKFPELLEALRTIHFPHDEQDAIPARKRFAFEELLLLQLRALIDRRDLQLLKAPAIAFQKDVISALVKRLPFELTGDQRRAAFEILQDIEKPFPMNRLLNGDVGSGKTVVALIAAFQVAQARYQAVMMAPTELLAQQHFHTITTLLNAETSVRVGLLTGSEARQWPSDEVIDAKISKKLMIEKIKKGDIDIVIGTHAVIQNGVTFKRLGLVVIDEQHRFGVKQRMKLVKDQAMVPHLLSMTATPIPRTLALTLYGDLDVSLLREKPKGRRDIITRVISDEKRAEAYSFIEKQIAQGRQIFVICPRIEKSADAPAKPSKALFQIEMKMVTEEFERLSKTVFPHRRVAMLHGKMPAKRKGGSANSDGGKATKEEIMNDFKAGRYDIIVSTSVIEVGVDVPNATMMMIESAERFGLAQLHQFRGRVGRGEHQSYCFLFTSSPDITSTRRLKAMEATNDGFALAEMDLKIRGPGEFTGTVQSGIPDLAMASLTDIALIKEARDEAVLLLQKDPNLGTHPLLADQLRTMQKIVHFE